MIYVFGVVKNFFGCFVFSLIVSLASTCMVINVDTVEDFQEALNDKTLANIHYTGEGIVNVQANKVVDGKSGNIAPPMFDPLKITCGDCRYTYETGWYDAINKYPNIIVKAYWNNFENCPQCGKKNWTVESVHFHLPPYAIS